jgi:hypothetical protein
MQHREQLVDPRSDLEALLARTDDAALDYVTNQLLTGGDFASPPPMSTSAAEPDLVEAG